MDKKGNKIKLLSVDKTTGEITCEIPSTEKKNETEIRKYANTTELQQNFPGIYKVYDYTNGKQDQPKLRLDWSNRGNKPASYDHEMRTYINSLANYDLQKAKDDDIIDVIDHEHGNGNRLYGRIFGFAKEYDCEPYQIATTENKIYILRKEFTSAYKYLEKGEITRQLERVLNKFAEEIKTQYNRANFRYNQAEDINLFKKLIENGDRGVGYNLTQALGFKPDEKLIKYIFNNWVNTDELSKRYSIANTKKFLKTASDESKTRFRNAVSNNLDYSDDNWDNYFKNGEKRDSNAENAYGAYHRLNKK